MVNRRPPHPTTPSLFLYRTESDAAMAPLKANAYTNQLLNAIQNQNGRELGNRYLNIQHSDATDLYIALPQSDTNFNYVSSELLSSAHTWLELRTDFGMVVPRAQRRMKLSTGG